ncbi:hypothetical protein ACFQDF_16605 [Ectobacillus funiculus]
MEVVQHSLEQSLCNSAIEYAKHAGVLIGDRLGNMGKVEQKECF